MFREIDREHSEGNCLSRGPAPQTATTSPSLALASGWRKANDQWELPFTWAGAPDGDHVTLADIGQVVGVPCSRQDVGQEQPLLVRLAVWDLQQVDVRCIHSS